MTQMLAQSLWRWNMSFLAVAAAVNGQGTLLDVNVTQVRIRAAACVAWQTAGTWETPDGLVLATWRQRCSSASPSDVDFFYNDSTTAIGRTDQSWPSLTTNVRVRDANGTIVASFTETILDHLLSAVTSRYELDDEGGIAVANSVETTLWDSTFSVRSTDNVQVLSASQKGSNKVAAAVCAADGAWDVSFSEAGPAWTARRATLLTMITVKLVRDMTRDKDGNVQGSLCQLGGVSALAQQLGWGLGVPLFFCLVIALFRGKTGAWPCVFVCLALRERRARI